MTLEQKNKYRLRFKLAAVGMVFCVLVVGGVLAFKGSVDGFTGIASSVCAFAGAVFGVDYFSSPKGDNNGK